MPSLGRYEILRPLARGGMAEVYLARRRSAGGIDKRMVIKRIRSERARDPRLLELFVREARVSMALSHQNIVPVFDFGRVGDELFLAMEYVDGRDLSTALTRAREQGGALTPALVAFLGSECCAALAYAHARRFDDGTVGLVHRDITPRNILLSWSGEVRITDFGVVALRGDESTVIRGTPHYMAPEQARGEALDGRADLYSLALVLHEAATGARVRSSDPDVALAEARAGTLPPLPDDLPDELVAVIARATSPDPAHRFADAREMQDALAELTRQTRGTPGRLLAEWMTTLFPDPDAEPASDPHVMEAVTFLEDGEAAVLGTGTAHSIASTAPEAAPPPPSPSPPEPPAPAPSPPSPSPRRSAVIPIALGAIALAGGLALAWNATRSPSSAPSPAAAPVDAAVTVAVQPPPPPPPDAAPPPIDAAPPPDAPPRHHPRPRAVDAGTTQPESALKRQVTIGSRPWSVFYVDKGSARHETPETIPLAPGPHTIRFVNQEAHIDRTITLEVPPDEDIKHVEILVPDNH